MFGRRGFSTVGPSIIRSSHVSPILHLPLVVVDSASKTLHRRRVFRTLPIGGPALVSL